MTKVEVGDYGRNQEARAVCLLRAVGTTVSRQWPS
jgi:hypothetical protein